MNANYEHVESLDEISLGESCYVDDHEVELDKLICRYTQRDNFKGTTRKFALYDKTYLVQQKDAPFKKVPEHRIDLTFLDPTPTSKLFISTGVAMLGLSMLLFLYGDQLGIVSDIPYVLLTAVLLTVAGLIIILLAYARSYL